VLRINAGQDADDTPRLALEGRLAGAWVAELAAAVAASSTPGRRLVLDMAGVTFVDSEGVRLALRLAGQGVVLRDCSPFVRELLEGACDDRTSGG
jgi:anti-anti-sigma regulatory factor